MGVLKTPKAPDPSATANAQMGINQSAATQTQLLNAVDQYTPDGSMTYKQTGNWTYTDPNGVQRTVPRLAQTTTLNPLQAQAKTYEQMVDRDTNRLGVTLLGNAQNMLSRPTDYSEASIKRKIDRMVNPRLDERFQRDRASLEARMANQGIKLGSAGFSDAMTDYERARTDAYSQEALNNRQQAITELGLGSRDAINSIGALLGTGQISAPQFAATPGGNIGAPDMMGQINQNYQAKVQRSNAAMGGLFGLGGSLTRAAGSAAGMPTG